MFVPLNNWHIHVSFVECRCDVHRVGTLHHPIPRLYDLGTVLLPEEEGKGGRGHFVPLMEVDFESDAVWKELQDRLDERVHREDERRAQGPIRNMWSGVAEMFHKL